MNHTHLTELLAEREGIMLSRSTVRRMLVGVGKTSGLPGINEYMSLARLRAILNALDVSDRWEYPIA